MIILNGNRSDILLRKLTEADFEGIHRYYENLTEQTRKRFGPHSFEVPAMREFYENNHVIGFIGEEIDTSRIVAYSILKIGYLAHDRPRLESYGLKLSDATDCAFAPSIADDWQGCGLGGYMFKFILSEIEELGINRIILWGGVQATNARAISFYEKHDFQKIGEFEYYGMNYDMVLEKRDVRSEKSDS